MQYFWFYTDFPLLSVLAKYFVYCKFNFNVICFSNGDKKYNFNNSYIFFYLFNKFLFIFLNVVKLLNMKIYNINFYLMHIFIQLHEFTSHESNQFFSEMNIIHMKKTDNTDWEIEKEKIKWFFCMNHLTWQQIKWTQTKYRVLYNRFISRINLYTYIVSVFINQFNIISFLYSFENNPKRKELVTLKFR